MPSIKLGVRNASKGACGSEEEVSAFRRVVPRVGERVDHFYTDLMLLAIEQYTHGIDRGYSRPEESDLDFYHIKLCYADPEGDTTVIGSSSELKIAIDLFREKGSMTITADVKPITLMERWRNKCASVAASVPRCCVAERVHDEEPNLMRVVRKGRSKTPPTQ